MATITGPISLTKARNSGATFTLPTPRSSFATQPSLMILTVGKSQPLLRLLIGNTGKALAAL